LKPLFPEVAIEKKIIKKTLTGLTSRIGRFFFFC